MFNEERKRTFIKYSCDNRGKFIRDHEQFLIKRFMETETYEEKLGKDLCEWTAPEILDFYKAKISRSLETLMVIHSALNSYARWCLINLLVPDSQNHFAEIDREILNSECINHAYLEKGIVDREQVLKLIRNPAINNVSEQFLILALFEGLGGKGYSDFKELTMENFGKNSVKLPNRTIRVSSELVELAKESANTYVYYTYGKAKREAPFDESDPRVIKSQMNSRGMDTNDNAYRHSMSVRIKRLMSECDEPAISSSMLFESGRLQMVKGFIEKDKGMDIDVILKRHQDEIANQYGLIHGRQRYVDKWSQFLGLTD